MEEVIFLFLRFSLNLWQHETMKPPEMIEGPEAFERFRTVMKAVLRTPHSEIKKRIEEQRTRAALNPNKRGPKGKPKRSASRVLPA